MVQYYYQYETKRKVDADNINYDVNGYFVYDRKFSSSDEIAFCPDQKNATRIVESLNLVDGDKYKQRRNG